jgi:hypothetical protein
MKIFKSLGSGTLRALKSWKGVLLIWFISLLLISLFVIPMKGSMKAGFGSSTIIDRLKGGIDIDVIADLGQYLASIISYVSTGFFFILFTGILINTFLAGGLFNSLKGTSEKLSMPDFFRASARYFWYFLGLYFLIDLIILVTGFLIIGLPVGLISQSENAPGGLAVIVGIITACVFLVLLIIFFLVCDYSRAWLVSAEKPAFFKALGFGFSETFSRFRSSFPMMLIIMVLLVLFGWLVSTLIGTWKPSTGGGVFLLFLVSQLLILIKILLKAWRYGSVTSLMEMNNQVKS